MTEPGNGEQVSKQRLQFDVTPEVLELIDDLKDQSGCATRAELFRKAIKLYALVLQEQSEGYTLHFKKDDDHKLVAIL